MLIVGRRATIENMGNPRPSRLFNPGAGQGINLSGRKTPTTSLRNPVN